jgi:hypothetical protein
MITATNWILAKYSCPAWNSDTDESALRNLLANLEDSSSSLHFWLGFCTLLVAVGVALEVVFVVWEYVDELHEFRRGIVRPPDRPITTLFVLGLFGAGLVAAGVSGELWKESQIATVETCIRKGNDMLFLLLSKEAGDAKTNSEIAGTAAKAAKEDAKAAKDESDSTIRELSRARKEISDLGTEAEKLDRGISDTKTQLGVVESKRAELEESLHNLAICSSPRVVQNWTIGNVKSAVDSLKPFVGYKAFIEFVSNDAETQRAATNILNSLLLAKWEVSEFTPVNEPIEEGVEIQPFEGPADTSMWGAKLESDHAADALVDFLHSYNWEVRRGFLLDAKGVLIRDPQIIPPGFA